MTAFEQALKAELEPWLLERGWKRQGKVTFLRFDRWHLCGIRIQQRQGNYASGASLFTANIVKVARLFRKQEVLEDYARSKWMWTEGGFYPLGAKVLVRIGELTQVGSDLWYAYDALDAADCRAVIGELCGDIEDHVLPCCDSALRLLWSRLKPGKSPARGDAHRRKADVLHRRILESANATQDRSG